MAAGDAKVSIVDVRDIAAIAALALTEKGHEGKTYEITGPESLTHREMANHLSAANEKDSEVRRHFTGLDEAGTGRLRNASIAGRGIGRGL